MRDPVQIYQGRFTDHNPGIHSAGKRFPNGDTVSDCLTELYPRPITPPVVQKFLHTRRPDPGAQTLFYGKANDPNVGKYMTHGLCTRSSLSAGSLINPRPKSLFQQKFTERNENLYFSHQWRPLGRSPDHAAAFPAVIVPSTITFGKTIKRGLSAGAVLNPPKSFQEIEEESKKGHELYVVTHNDYNVGELRERKYDPTKFQKDKCFGIETPHFNDGRNIRHSIQWISEKKRKEGATIISERLDDFRERTQPQIGKVLDPNASTRNLPPNHTFGALLQPEKYGVGDLIHCRSSKNFLRGKDRHRASLASVQQHLKKANYKNFGSLLEAFRHYDKNCDGKIDKNELRDACSQFGLELNNELLDSLLQYCDVDKDGLINFVEFANFLNWKDKMIIAEWEEKILTQGTNKLDEGADHHLTNQERAAEGLVKPAELEFKEGVESAKTPVTLSKEDHVKGFYITSSSKINAVVGGSSSARFRASGVPTIRTDISPPRIRRFGDRNNYGDGSDAYGLLCPSVFSQKMVYESDFLKPRSKEEISQILHNMDVDISGENFDQLWDVASKSHPRGKVSVETMRNALARMPIAQTTYLER